MKLYVDDEPMLLSVADLESYDRSLDFRDGVLRRDIVWRTPAGKRVKVCRRGWSRSPSDAALLSIEVTMLMTRRPS